MGIVQRTGPRGKAAVLLAASAVGEAAARLSDPAGGPQERSIHCNQTGPPGLQGVAGQTGPAGRTLTIAAANTITIGGAVVTVGRSSGLTIAAPPLGRHTFAQVTLGSGRPALSFGILGLSF